MSAAQSLLSIPSTAVDLLKSYQEIADTLTTLARTGAPFLPYDLIKEALEQQRGFAHLEPRFVSKIGEGTSAAQLSALAKEINDYILVHRYFNYVSQMPPEDLQRFFRSPSTPATPRLIPKKWAEQLPPPLLASVFGCNKDGYLQPALCTLGIEYKRTMPAVAKWSQLLVPAAIKEEVDQAISRADLALLPSLLSPTKYRELAAQYSEQTLLPMPLHPKEVWHPTTDSMLYFLQHREAIQRYQTAQATVADQEAYFTFFSTWKCSLLEIAEHYTPSHTTHQVAFLGEYFQATSDVVSLLITTDQQIHLLTTERPIGMGFDLEKVNAIEQDFDGATPPGLLEHCSLVQTVPVLVGGMAVIKKGGEAFLSLKNTALQELYEEAATLHVPVPEELLSGIRSSPLGQLGFQHMVDHHALVQVGDTLEFRIHPSEAFESWHPQDQSPEACQEEVATWNAVYQAAVKRWCVGEEKTRLKEALDILLETPMTPFSFLVRNFGDERAQSQRATQGAIFTQVIRGPAADALLAALQTKAGNYHFLSLTAFADCYSKKENWSDHFHFVGLALASLHRAGQVPTTEELEQFLQATGMADGRK